MTKNVRPSQSRETFGNGECGFRQVGFCWCLCGRDAGIRTRGKTALFLGNSGMGATMCPNSVPSLRAWFARMGRSRVREVAGSTPVYRSTLTAANHHQALDNRGLLFLVERVPLTRSGHIRWEVRRKNRRNKPPGGSGQEERHGERRSDCRDRMDRGIPRFAARFFISSWSQASLPAPQRGPNPSPASGPP
jgi:hypothetical protein